jgi:hypothetical protein
MKKVSRRVLQETGYRKANGSQMMDYSKLS